MTSEHQSESDKAVSSSDLVRPVSFANALQWLLGKTSKLRNLRKRLYPISDLQWWYVFCRWMINPNPPHAPYKLSRLTRIMFLLDPGTYYVWPHPRIEDYPSWRNAGTVLARLLVTLRNPGYEARIIEHLSPKTTGKTPHELEDQVNEASAWRYRMFVSYGDKWPNDKLTDPDTFQQRAKPQ